MAYNIMIQGTMSGAGKSLITAGLLRILSQCKPARTFGREPLRDQLYQRSFVGFYFLCDMGKIASPHHAFGSIVSNGSCCL